MKRTLALSALLAVLAPTAFAQTVAPVPSLMNFQGRLAKPNGTPVTDGFYTVTFRIYDAQTGGNLRWQEQSPSVYARNGTFATLLGNITQLTDSIFNGTVWLELQVNTDAPLSPRQRVTSVAYAFKANTVPDGAITTTKIADGAITAAKLAPGVGGGANGTAGGDLTGTYPNPLIALGSVTSAKLASDPTSLEKVSNGTLAVTAGSIDLRGQQIGANPSNDFFTYQGFHVGNYSLSWTQDSWQPQAPTAWFSGYGGIKLFTFDTPRMAITEDGKIGIGTETPASTLTVAGQIQTTAGGIKFPDGTVQTTASGTDAIRIVSGTVNLDGNILSGTGFTVQKVNTGIYLITFTQPFPSQPTATATQIHPDVDNIGYVKSFL